MALRDRDRKHRVDAFSNKAHKFKAAHLFDIESVTHNIFEYASGICPNLPSLFLGKFNPSIATSHAAMDSFKGYSEEDLRPLYGLLGKLFCLVDDRVHTQQCAGKTKVGYNAYYEYKMAQENGLSCFSDQRAGKGYWAEDKQDSEQGILKVKTNEESLSAVLAQGKGHGKPI